MTSLEELCAAVDGTGIPWANTSFEGGEPSPPFIVLVPGYTDTAYADNAAWYRWMPYDVALYVRDRDIDAEARVEEALDAIGAAWEKAVTRIDGEHLVETAYTVNVQE